MKQFSPKIGGAITHSPAIFCPRSAQPPFCSAIKANIPDRFICSKTTKTTNYFYPIDDNNHLSVLNSDSFNKDLSLEDIFQWNPNSIPLLDPSILKIHTQISERSVIKVIPVAPLNVYQEFLKKSKKYGVSENIQGKYKFNQRLISQQLSPLVVKLTPFSIKESEFIKTDKPYLLLSFDIKDIDTSLGKMSSGIVSPYLIGTFLTSYLTRNIVSFGSIQFAIGVKGVEFQHSTLENHRLNHSKVNTSLYLVLSIKDGGFSQDQVDSIKVRFKRCTQFHNYQISSSSIYYQKTLPVTYWLKDANSEIKSYMSQNAVDALSATLRLNSSECNQLFPLAVGFSLLSAPFQQTHEQMNKEVINTFGWSELLLKPTYLKYSEYQSSFVYQLHLDHDYGAYYWEQEI